jgi:hypothetical protein
MARRGRPVASWADGGGAMRVEAAVTLPISTLTVTGITHKNHIW